MKAKISPANCGDMSATDFLDWDVRNWSAALDFWVANTTQDLSVCSALEIGAGPGGLSTWLATHGVHVVCSDRTSPPLSVVRRHEMQGVAHLIEYQAVDALDIPHTNQFDIVLFRSVL